MRNKRVVKKNKNLNNFFIYLFTILGASSFFISFLTIKNQCTKLSNEITNLDKSISRNISIVKKLQNDKSYYLSEEYISNAVKEDMIVVAPEPEIIKISND